MHSDIRRLATNLDVKLHGLQQMFSGSNQQSQIDGVKHLKEFVQSAATVLSSTSTVLSADEPEDEHPEDGDDFRSDFGDWFKTEVNVSTLDWIYSTNRSTFIFDLSQTQTSAQPLAETSHSPRDQRPSSLSPTPTANQLSQEALSNLNLSKSREIQPKVSSPRLKDKKKEGERPTSNIDLVPVLPSSPSYSRTKSPELPLSPVSRPKENRRSLTRLFSRKSSPYEKSEEEPKPKKLPLFRKSQGAAEIRRKCVFVGDGACGKTCFLM
jgi:hypothetical protein